MTEKPLTPEEIVRSLHAQLIQEERILRESVERAALAKGRVKRARKFILDMCRVWSIQVPPMMTVPVTSHPKPEGIEVDETTEKELTCDECGFVAKSKGGLGVHASRAHG